MASIQRLLLRRAFKTPPKIHHHQTRTIIPAPAPNSGPLLSRRSDRALPSLSLNSPLRIWRHLPIVLLVVGASAIGIFNYQKSNHSVINSSLYALRMSDVARAKLGDEIYFRDRIPWIGGTIDSLHGEVDVRFGVKGKSGRGVMRFRCVRPRREQFFRTEIWTLTMEDGEVVDLLEASDADPVGNTASFA